MPVEGKGFWFLSFASEGYIVSMDAVHQMLKDHDLYDKHIINIVATPRRLIAVGYGPSPVSNQPKKRTYRRRWRT